jgi:hypothetical protein
MKNVVVVFLYIEPIWRIMAFANRTFEPGRVAARMKGAPSPM